MITRGGLKLSQFGLIRDKFKLKLQFSSWVRVLLESPAGGIIHPSRHTIYLVDNTIFLVSRTIFLANCTIYPTDDLLTTSLVTSNQV